MEQDVDNGFKAICSACLSGDRNLVSLNSLAEVVEVFKLLMYDFAGERMIDSESELKQYVCWECFAIMKKIYRFKRQIHNAQQHLRVLSLQSSWETMDHAYFSQSLSSLESVIKPDYDRMYIDYTYEEPGTTEVWTQPYFTVTTDVKSQQYDVAQTLRENITLGIDDRVLGMPEIVVENPVTGVMSHIVVGDPMVDTIAADPVKGELPELILDSSTSVGSVIIKQPIKLNDQVKEEDDKLKSGYVTEYMCEADMLAYREEAKLKVLYASSVYKCELCIIGFHNQQQVEEHFVSAHRAKLGYEPCKVCYVYVDSALLAGHVASHYTRLVCRLCGHEEFAVRQMKLHVQTHMAKPPPSALIKIGDAKGVKKKKQKEADKTPPKPGDLRKLLSKTTIVGYKCLECDMFFKNSRARKNHVARSHREGLQCDHCKKRFVNRTTLATHLRLHEGPLPREKCPVCDKMVRVIQLKYHIQRHQNTERYECKDCDKVFSHLTTYQAHLKYSRPHASDHVFKFPCPMCNKGYPTKEAMQDHFNYQHLGKTTHKCPVCSKPIASKANVEKHMMRVHGEKKEKPRSHVCQQCGKGFTDKKALSQHAVIHSVDRPLSCDICHQTFKQKASLYTHKKRVHKVFPSKRVVEFMDLKKES